MPAITIKNLPDDLYERLKANSKAHHRSSNGELIATLERALTAQRVDAEQHLARIPRCVRGWICRRWTRPISALPSKPAERERARQLIRLGGSEP
jgi:plasmid stability protein